MKKLERRFPISSIIVYPKADDTDYVRAQKGRNRTGAPNWMDTVFGGTLGSTIGSCFLWFSLIIGVFPAIAGWLGAMVLGGWLGGRKNRKFVRETLANPAKRFEWLFIRAVESYNERVDYWKYLLEGRELGVVDVSEDELGRIHDILSRTHDALRRWQSVVEWVKKVEGKSNFTGCFATSNLAEDLIKLDEETRTQFAAVGPGGAENFKRLLENESALLDLEGELRGLLPAKTGGK